MVDGQILKMGRIKGSFCFFFFFFLLSWVVPSSYSFYLFFLLIIIIPYCCCCCCCCCCPRRRRPCSHHLHMSMRIHMCMEQHVQPMSQHGRGACRKPTTQWYLMNNSHVKGLVREQSEVFWGYLKIIQVIGQ